MKFNSILSQLPNTSKTKEWCYFCFVHLFGVQDEAAREQINDENELLGKGPNGTLSLVFDGIKQLNGGEKHLKVTCDNAGGQNKNNTTIWFYLYLVIDESIELNFMVPGHTKFKCDGSFGLIKGFIVKLQWTVPIM